MTFLIGRFPSGITSSMAAAVSRFVEDNVDVLERCGDVRPLAHTALHEVGGCDYPWRFAELCVFARGHRRRGPAAFAKEKIGQVQPIKRPPPVISTGLPAAKIGWRASSLSGGFAVPY